MVKIFGVLMGVFGISVAHASTCDEKPFVVTEHEMRVNQKTISYSATVGFLKVQLDTNAAVGCIFFTYYHIVRESNQAPRPLTFAYNGGPGSASLWLQCVRGRPLQTCDEDVYRREK
jgi:carboxypeptidase C (cathepsin A)